MPRPKPTRPTDFELDILAVLWDRGGGTVRDVHETLMKARPELGRTTVSKIMDIMVDKKLIHSLPDRRPAIFVSSIPQQNTQRSLVKDLIARVFQGSAAQMVMHALGKKTSKEDLAEIRKMIDKIDAKT